MALAGIRLTWIDGGSWSLEKDAQRNGYTPFVINYVQINVSNDSTPLLGGDITSNFQPFL